MVRAFPILCLIVLGGMAVPALAGPLTYKTVTIKTETKHDLLNIAYPKTGIAAIDEDLSARVKELRKLYAHDPNDDMTERYALYIAYSVPRNDSQMFVINFTVESDTGGAHPNHDTETFTFLMPDGWRAYLPEIFDGQKALNRISALAIKNLTRDIGGPDGMSDPKWIAGGAGPEWDNFRAFVLTPKSLNLIFQPYQVAAYAAGPQRTSIPLSALSDVMRKDWRSPVPSFDCVDAKTEVEQMLCSDIQLARLDRRMASAYHDTLSYTQDEKAKAGLRASQRAWLAGRKSACHSGVAGQTACLTAYYQKRLATLNAGP